MNFLKITVAAVLCELVLQGCAAPNARQLSAEPTQSTPTKIAGPNGDLSAARGDKVLTDMARASDQDQLLLKQVALQGEIAGTPLVAANKVTLLENGRATYDAMMRAIVAAKENISMESYIFEADSIGQSIGELLIAKSRAGISVQIIYDSQGSLEAPSDFWGRLRAAGIQVLEYNPMNPLNTRVGYDPNARDHRKMLIVDGSHVVMGGINISEIYLYGGVDSGSADRWWLPWRDTDIEIDGPVASQIQQFFLDTWNEQKGDPLPDRKFFPAIPAQGDAYVRALPGAPDKGDPQIYIALLSAMRHAEHHIWLTTGFFDPTDEDVDVLKEAAARGVDVTLEVSGESDSQATLAAGRSHYTDLLRAGIKIFERRDAFLHGKTATIDGVWSIIGSSNLDARSVIWNKELSAIVLGRGFAGQMEAVFQKDLMRAVPIDLAHWADRSFFDRAGQWSARLLEPLL